MLKNYLNLMFINLEDAKDYIYSIDKEGYNKKLEQCFTMKQLKLMIQKKQQHYLNLGIKHLYSTENFDDLENDLIMMNYFFSQEREFDYIKVHLKDELLKIEDKINLYRILRHLVNIDTKTIIETLYHKSYINEEQAAYFSLIENQIEKAYYYLYAMNDQPHDKVLDLYSSYDLIGTYKLLRHYHQDHKMYEVSYS